MTTMVQIPYIDPRLPVLEKQVLYEYGNHPPKLYCPIRTVTAKPKMHDRVCHDFQVLGHGKSGVLTRDRQKPRIHGL